jgi:hypothetical protein
MMRFLYGEGDLHDVRVNADTLGRHAKDIEEKKQYAARHAAQQAQTAKAMANMAQQNLHAKAMFANAMAQQNQDMLARERMLGV